MRSTMLVLLIVVAVAGHVMAAETEEDDPKAWQPVAPEGLPEDFDWIRLTSDEWLKGEILEMYDDELKFDSDNLGVLTLDFEDVAEIRSSRVIQVGFGRRSSVVGRLLLDGDVGRVVIGGRELAFPRDQILTLVVGAPKEANYWSLNVSLGGNLRSGNTEQSEITARLGAQRRTVRNRIGFEYLGTVARLDSEETTNNHRSSLDWDQFLTQRLYVNVVGAEWYRDRFQNIDDRWTVNAGLGYEVIGASATTWTVSGGPAWQSTRFVSVAEGDDGASDSFALRVGTRLDHELTRDIDVYLDYNAYFTDKESGSYNHHLDTGISFDLFGDLEADLSWVWDRIRDPRSLDDGSVPEQDDYRLIFGLGWSF